MSSAFDSFNGSALGARVQSAVDGEVFGGGIFGVVEVLSISLSTLRYRQTSGDIIKCSGGISFWSQYRAPDPDEDVGYLQITFRDPDGISSPIFDGGAWQVSASCATVGSVRITGRDSGTVLTIPAVTHATTGAGTYSVTSTLRQLSASFPVPDVATYFGIPSISLFTYLYNAPGVGDPIPADVDFDAGELCDIELL